MRKSRILWASPFNLHDTTSGAAIQSRTMLEQLAKRGLDVSCMGCMVFDSPAGMSMLKSCEDQIAASKNQWLSLEDGGMTYLYMKTESTQISKLTDAEQRQFFSRYMATLKGMRPDVVMMYGGGCMEYAMRAEAALHGIPCVYVVCNGNHRQYAFPYADLVLTDSKSTAAYYARESRIVVQPIGTFINPDKVVFSPNTSVKPEYVTFINPVPAKGVSIVARLALMAREALPGIKFLVVQSRGNWPMALAQLKNRNPNETELTAEAFSNMVFTDNQADMRGVYAATRALLVPSLWYECWGRVATEATMNGIPAIVSDCGGLPEAVGEGGVVVPCPKECHADHLRMPTEEDIQPWLAALKDVLDPDRAGHWREEALKAAKENSLERSTERLLDALYPLLQRCAGSNPRLLMAGSTPVR